jgi:uncharacterized membrane protein YphA (DoxX/SURF4 family)
MPHPRYNDGVWARRILAVVLLAMGAGKLSDPGGYAHALAAFRVIPDAALAGAAWSWLACELVAGALLLVGGRAARVGAILALAINVAYAVMTTQAYARHLSIDNCTCFGVHLRQRLSWFVLLQDAYMIGLSAYVFAGARRSRRPATAGSTAR